MSLGPGEEAAAFFRGLQDDIVGQLERADGGAFREDQWTRPGGGGGRTRVLSEGALFEKAGVSFSDVHGELRPEMAAAMPGDGTRFRATGVSLVLHPRSPRVPTVHANVRHIQRGSASWFGGGTDLTPYYVVREDAVHFHSVLRDTCAAFDAGFYPRFKRWCDDYFFLPHRAEPRGVGGLFFDYLGAGAEKTAGQPARPASDPSPSPSPSPSASASASASGRSSSSASSPSVETDGPRLFAFVRALGEAVMPAYLPIVERRRHEPWGERERRWQLTRRGRYVEFNLLYDRGTLFGLRTDGRIESILMSLPPEVRWDYAAQPEPGSPEAESLAAICARADWVTAGC